MQLQRSGNYARRKAANTAMLGLAGLATFVAVAILFGFVGGKGCTVLTGEIN